MRAPNQLYHYGWGPLDIVHPVHRLATPLATTCSEGKDCDRVDDVPCNNLKEAISYFSKWWFLPKNTFLFNFLNIKIIPSTIAM